MRTKTPNERSTSISLGMRRDEEEPSKHQHRPLKHSSNTDIDTPQVHQYQVTHYINQY